MKKKLKLMCVVILLSTTSMAQQTKSEPATQSQKRGTKITFPPNAMAKMNAFGDVELVADLASTSVIVVGNSEQGLILETEKGEKVVMNKTRKTPPRLIRIPPSLRWTPIVPKPSTPIKYKLIGIDDKNNAVWESTIKKGRCKIDETTGKTIEYNGHITLLR
jgi:hypothetical protein